MKKLKTMFLLFMCVVSLCAVTTQPAQSQTVGGIYILSDGTIESTVNATIPLQQDGDVYTFTADILATTFAIQRSHVTIDGAGFTLSGQGEIGIDLSSANNVTVKDVHLAGLFFYGVYIGGTSNTVTGCTIEGNGDGVSFDGAKYNNVTGNIIRSNDVGINLLSSSGNVFRDNQLDNTHNIALYGTEASHYVNDMDTSNIIDGDKKVYYFVGENNIFIGPDSHPDVGFLAFVSCSDVTVYGTTVSRNVHGIVIASTINVTIVECEISYNHIGLMIFASTQNVIGNTTITENVRGIQLSMFSSENRIFGNEIVDNRGGIFLFNSSSNNIYENNIKDNDGYGIGFSSASYNIIRSNMFINNGKQVIDSSTEDSTVTPSLNTWSVSSNVGGNYWSDYTGVDVKSGVYQNETGSDNLGDTPYIINANNKDAYPLMLFGSSPIVNVTSPENTTYSTTSITLSYSVSEETSWVGYSLDGEANVTITGATTLSGLSYGVHNVTVYVTDTEGYYGKSNTTYFTVTSGESSGEPFPSWILAVIIVAVVAVILFFFVRIMKQK